MKSFTNFLSISLVFFIIGVEAQDPHFSQFYANPIYLNPSFAGTEYCPRVIVNYRNQWPGLTGNFITYAATYDQFAPKLGGGIGVSVLHDRAGEGTLNTTNISLIYSYNRVVNRHFSIRAALQATFFQKTLNWEKLTFGDMIDPRYGFIYQTQEQQGKTTKNGVDFSAGILAFSKKFFGGFAAHHLTQPDEGLIGISKLPIKYTAHAGANIPITRDGDESSVSPNILFMQQQNFVQFNMGIYARKGPITGGLWYRKDDSFILLVGVHLGTAKIGYSYDITVSKLTVGNTYGAHEISLQYRFKCKTRKTFIREMPCPVMAF